ncbi:MAG: DUF4203 domain-containing protein [Thermodesulfobacteriota bacterium]
MNITPTTLKLLSIIAALFGLLICFFGYKIFRLVLAILGFIIGASFLAGVGFTLTDGNEILIILIAGIAGGLVAAVILLFLYSAGVFLLGALFGISVFSGILMLINIDTSPLLYIMPAILGGIIALLLQKFMIILITSFAGAWIAVIGTLYVINSDFNPFTPEFINNISEIDTYRILLSLMALGGLGFVVQYIIFPKKEEKTSTVEHSSEQDDSN